MRCSTQDHMPGSPRQKVPCRREAPARSLAPASVAVLAVVDIGERPPTSDLCPVAGEVRTDRRRPPGDDYGGNAEIKGHRAWMKRMLDPLPTDGSPPGSSL